MEGISDVQVVREDSPDGLVLGNHVEPCADIGDGDDLREDSL